MNRVLMAGAVVLLSNAAFAQKIEIIAPNDPVPFGGPQPAGAAIAPRDGDEQALRRQLVETLQSRLDQLSPEQLRRALEVIEADGSPLPPAAVEVLDAYRQQAGPIQREANAKIAVHRKQTLADLKLIQDRLTRDGQLDEALAVRDLIRNLHPVPTNVQADPGSLAMFRGQNGKSLFFRVTGNMNGIAWGSDVYTDDSNLAFSAVHAGVLRNGQTGIVKVTIAAGRDTYAGSTRNGVTSNPYGQFPGSFRVERVPPEAEAEEPAGAPPAGEPGRDPPASLPLDELPR